jgi:hypothetical protein
MEKKGQGALEYLLLIGGAVLIAVIVIAVVTGMVSNPNPVTNTARCAQYMTCDQCKVTGTGTCAGYNTTGVRITWAAPVAGACNAADVTAFASCKAV